MKAVPIARRRSGPEVSGGPGARCRRPGPLVAGLCGLLAAGLAGALMVPLARASSSVGTTLEITAGTGALSAIVPGPGLSSPLHFPKTLASDRSGNVYIAFGPGSSDQRSVARLSAAGTISYLLNAPRLPGPPVAGEAASSTMGTVSGVAADAAGNVYVGDSEYDRVVKVSASGWLSIIAGDGSGGTTIAGAATAVPVTPGVLAVGPDGSVFVATASRRVVKVDTSGQLSLVAGNGAYGHPTPGTSLAPVAALASPLTGVSGLAVDSSGNLFLSLQNSHCVIMVDPDGWLTTVAGLCGTAGAAVPGPALTSRLEGPRQLAVDLHGLLYIVDKQNKRIERVTSPASGAGTLSIIAGNGVGGALLAGPALNTPLARVTGLTVDWWSNLYLAEGDSSHLAKIAGVGSVPDAPTGLTADGGPGSLVLTFRPPVDSGGRAITSYEVSMDVGATWQELASSGSVTGPITATLRNLPRATTYTLAVRAVNGIGAGAMSGPASGTTLDVPSTSPTSTDTSTSTPTPSPTGTSTPSPTVTPRPSKPPVTPRPPVPTAGLIPIPANPRAYRGPRRLTKALNRSYTGVAATPAAKQRTPLKRGQATVLSEGALFQGDTPRLTARGRSEVKRLARLFRRGATVRCEGYTDYAGQPTRQKSLSLGRAKAICGGLVAYGARVKYTTAGYGGEHPVVVGGTPATRAENLRVVVVVTR